MKPRFQPDVTSGAEEDGSASLIDPEAYDASEQQFAASLESTVSSRQPRFIVQDEPPEPVSTAEAEASSPRWETGMGPGMVTMPAAEKQNSPPPDPDAWRREVADRLSHYRARRRTREPRYPSLQLKFEPDPISSSAVAQPELTAPSLVHSAPEALDRVHSPAAPRITLAEPVNTPRIMPAPFVETTAKVIDFASYSTAFRAYDELAEPVFDRPRIIEAPELAFPPPALGGILIEPVDEPENERRPGFEIPLQAAPMSRRMTASAIDFMLVISAFAAFAYIFFRFSSELPPLSQVAGTGVLLIAVLWSAYQYLLLVYSGTTPGLRLAKLELQRFDGSPAPFYIRRWRVLASVLSGLSLGLGYAWCFLDEDGLCWHDRITRTYMAPRTT